MGEKEEILRENFLKVFKTAEGEAVLKYLKEFSGMKDGRFVPDPRLETFFSGRRSVVCEIERILEKKEKKEK
jgi:hypothetical protein